MRADTAFLDRPRLDAHNLMPFSFMPLLVIPALKIGDRGLFDGLHFRFAPLFEN